MSDVVHYNYAAMEGVAEGIALCGRQYEAQLQSTQANKAAMLGHFHGAAADTMQACTQKYESALTDMIEIVNRGHASYADGTASMAAAEHAQSAAFPG